MRLRPVLRSKALNQQTKVRLIENFVSPVRYYGLSTIVLRVQDNRRLQASLNTARRMILGLYSRRALTNEELSAKIPLRCPAAIIQRRRLALWVGLSRQFQGLTKKLLGSKFAKEQGSKASHTKNWQRQLQADVKECFAEKGSDWLGKPTKLIPKNDFHVPHLVGQRLLTIKCTNSNCCRMFARKAEMSRHVRLDHSLPIQQESGGMLNCPQPDCQKQYKLKGWLLRHIQSCHRA